MSYRKTSLYPWFLLTTMECRLQVVPDLRWSPPRLYKKQGKENSTFAHHTELLTWNANINFFFTDFDFRNRHHQKGGSALSLKGVCLWRWSVLISMFKFIYSVWCNSRLVWQINVCVLLFPKVLLTIYQCTECWVETSVISPVQAAFQALYLLWHKSQEPVV